MLVLNMVLPWYISSFEGFPCLCRRNAELHLFWLVLVGQVLVWEGSVSCDPSLLLLVRRHLVFFFFVARCPFLTLICFLRAKLEVCLLLGDLISWTVFLGNVFVNSGECLVEFCSFDA